MKFLYEIGKMPNLYEPNSYMFVRAADEVIVEIQNLTGCTGPIL